MVDEMVWGDDDVMEAMLEFCPNPQVVRAIGGRILRGKVKADNRHGWIIVDVRWNWQPAWMNRSTVSSNCSSASRAGISDPIEAIAYALSLLREVE